ncbi:sigma-70 family RNA polymerase sigma factor [Pedobacter sp. SYSU D00535]|uniref:RNA polymerase sigma factor n=1 Tax=Pedobacter sp. SYSU D00535 TaxID=2810308 RepID=UPI001A975453
MRNSKVIGDDDQALWSSYRGGNATAYNALIRKYSNLLFRYGIRFVPDRDFVKDCIQDVFFELWNRREAINPTGSVKSYLLKALRLRIFREKAKWTTSETLDDDYCFEIEFNVESKLIESQTTEEMRLRMADALNKLPKRQKEILYLRFYEGLDHERISQVMGLNKQSSYNLLHEAIMQLKHIWVGQLVTPALFILIM